jgi:hypothetical protein
MKSGIFGHMDDSGVPPGQQLADRMRLVEATTASGSTPVSPSMPRFTG